MTKQHAEELYALVNSNAWSIYLDYVRYQIGLCHAELEWQLDNAAARTQGRIVQLRQDLELKEKVNRFFDK